MFGSIHWLNTSFLLHGRMDTEENSQMSDIVEQSKHHSDTNWYYMERILCRYLLCMFIAYVSYYWYKGSSRPCPWTNGCWIDVYLCIHCSFWVRLPGVFDTIFCDKVCMLLPVKLVLFPLSQKVIASIWLSYYWKRGKHSQH